MPLHPPIDLRGVTLLGHDGTMPELHVLHLEDDSAQRQLMRFMLDGSPLGTCTMHEADRLSAAFALMAVQRIDLALVDLGLPDSTGLATLEQLQARRPDVLYIVYSGDADEPTADAALAMGAQDVLVKGEITPIVLRRALRHAVVRHRLELERRHLVLELRRALTEIETLSGLLPMCAWCKRIRDDDGAWSGVEEYISRRTPVKFSHDICPSCESRLLKE